MADDDKVFLEAADRLNARAAAAGVDPMEFLHGEISGRSADHCVQVWVNALGQVQRTRIRPGTLVEGDEERVAEAFTQAAAAAARTAADLFTPDGIKARIKELDENPERVTKPAPKPDRDSW